ncbi:MAG: recombinase family protein, partial [Clostridia bacterium]|nr:recombinase family protein [Clostridia bacterium]
MLRGACYIRVSTDNQTEFSPDAQLKAIKKYAENNNIILDDDYVFVDEGISGRKADKRPAFQEMIKIAKSKPKKFDVILVHKFDRFARSREDSVVYKSLLKKECNIKVVSITESIEDDKFSVILEAMLEAMAEYYSLNLSDEVKKGMTEKAERGQYQASPPFGYKMKDGKLEIVEDEANIVKVIFEKFTSKELNILQITKYINNLGYKTHRGNSFENRTIEYILTNPVYIGYSRWTPTGKIKNGR